MEKNQGKNDIPPHPYPSPPGKGLKNFIFPRKWLLFLVKLLCALGDGMLKGLLTKRHSLLTIHLKTLT